MIDAERYAETFDPSRCPDWVVESLDRYINHRLPPGDCLTAILANDLSGAFARADVNTARAMGTIASYIYNNVRSDCHGSYERVKEWLS